MGGKKFSAIDSDDYDCYSDDQDDNYHYDEGDYDFKSCNDLDYEQRELERAISESLKIVEPKHREDKGEKCQPGSSKVASAGLKEKNYLRKVSQAVPRISEKQVQSFMQYQRDNYPGGHIYMSIVGHVDSGKSTLVGHLLSVIMEKNEMSKKSSHRGLGNTPLAWILDSNEEERQRGITMDISVSSFNTRDLHPANDKAALANPFVHVTFIDTPGHADFLSGMIVGTSLSQLTVLVIDAIPGAFEAGIKRHQRAKSAKKVIGGNTRDHLWILKAFDVQYVIVAINKIDAVSRDNVQARIEEIKGELLNIMTQEIDYHPMYLSFIPISALSGINLFARDSPLSLLEAVEEVGAIIPRPLLDTLCSNEAVALLCQVVKSSSSSTTVDVKIVQGSFKSGDNLMILPYNQTCTISHISNAALNKSGKIQAWKNDFVGLTLTGRVDPSFFRQGLILASIQKTTTTMSKSDLFKVDKDFLASITLLPDRPTVITPGFACLLAIQMTVETVRISKLLVPTKYSSQKPVPDSKTLRYLKEGQSADVSLSFEQPFPVLFDSKFVLLSDGSPIGYGRFHF